MSDTSILVVEDGSGLANSNAYMSAAAMLAYFAAVGVDISVWGVPRIEQRLVLATRYMTSVYRDRWQGQRINYIQALDWPRYGVLLSLGAEQAIWYPGFGMGYATTNEVFPQNAVPNEVLVACAELAYRADLAFGAGEAGGVGALLPDQQPGDEAVIAETVGPISVRYEAGRSTQPVYSYVGSVLRPFLRYGSGQTMLVRG